MYIHIYMYICIYIQYIYSILFISIYIDIYIQYILYIYCIYIYTHTQATHMWTWRDFAQIDIPESGAIDVFPGRWCYSTLLQIDPHLAAGNVRFFPVSCQSLDGRRISSVFVLGFLFYFHFREREHKSVCASSCLKCEGVIFFFFRLFPACVLLPFCTLRLRFISRCISQRLLK